MALICFCIAEVSAISDARLTLTVYNLFRAWKYIIITESVTLHCNWVVL